MSDAESVDSFEIFSGDGVDYNPLFVTKERFANCDLAFKWAKEIALDNEFALVKATNGSKNRRQPELLASYFRCSRYGRSKSVYDPEKPKKKPRTQKCNCQFRVRAVQDYHCVDNQRLILWSIDTAPKFGFHNHDLTKYKDGHRHYAGLDKDEKAFVKQEYTSSILPRDIKAGLHHKTPDKPQPSSRQIYNETSKLRRELMGERNPAQQMLASAVKANYVHWHESNLLTHELTHVFMSHPEAIKLFRAYPHVILMDSTYKTNIYKMTLVEVVGVTPVGSSFLIACVLILTESEEGYTWLLRKLMDILDCTGTSPSAFVTDRELGLVGALRKVYPDTPHLFCRWHVNRVIENRALLIHKNEWYKNHVLRNSETGWYNVINAQCEEAFKEAWDAFSNKWSKLATYVSNTWGEHACKFVLCYTNDYFHLGNTATSRVESAHSLLKAWLKSAHLTLDTMWSRIHSMIEAQHCKIRKELEESRSRPRITHRLFSLLQGKVSIKAIEIMEEEIRRGDALGVGLEDGCGCVLRTTHGLPCACHLIDLRNKGRRVHLCDVNAFWRTLEYDSDEVMPSNDNDMFDELVDEARKSDPAHRKIFIETLRNILHPEDEDIFPPAIRDNPKGRPRGSTTRSKSSFEHSRSKYGTPSTDASTNAQHRICDFPAGEVGAPLEKDYTIGIFSTWIRRYGVPECLWSFFDGWKDVGNDGHCGYRVISHGQRGQEDDYVVMREWEVREIMTHDIYKDFFGATCKMPNGYTSYENALTRIAFYRKSPCGDEHWMNTDDLFVFASMFNWTICMIAQYHGLKGDKAWQCSTILPLRSSFAGGAPYGVLWILNHNFRWMRLHCKGPPHEVPMPPIDPAWETFRDPSVQHLKSLYQPNIDYWHICMGTTPTVPRSRSNNRREVQLQASRALVFDVESDDN